MSDDPAIRSETAPLRVVYKYTPRPENRRFVEVKGSNPIIRHLAGVGDDIQVWIEHDVAGRSRLEVDVVPTGVQGRFDLPFLSTVLLYDGALVFHVYGQVTDA